MSLWTVEWLIIMSLRHTCSQLYMKIHQLSIRVNTKYFDIRLTWAMVRSNHLMDSYGMTRDAVSVPSGSTDLHVSNTVCSSNLPFVSIVESLPMRAHLPGVEETLTQPSHRMVSSGQWVHNYIEAHKSLTSRHSYGIEFLLIWKLFVHPGTRFFYTDKIKVFVNRWTSKFEKWWQAVSTATTIMAEQMNDRAAWRTSMKTA